MPETKSPSALPRIPDRWSAAAACAIGVMLHFWVTFKLLLAYEFAPGIEPSPRLLTGLWMFACWVLGLFAARFLHRFRVLGLVPPAATALFVASLWVAATDDWGLWVTGPVGLGCGLVVGAYYRNLTRPAGWTLVDRLVIGAVIGIAVVSTDLATVLLPQPAAIAVTKMQVVILAGLLAVFAWFRFRRPAVELVIEQPMRLAYRYTTAGPGLAAFPARGPCLLIANHAAYLDPLFLAEVAPRSITPMMTATFYDKPVIRQLMLYVFDTIRVPETAMKRDTGELDAAIAAIDAGKCVVIFPEGYLRRREDQPLRRFGRGIWEILRRRPDTPVVACWIEGGWGSYFSFKDGPPTKNKRRDVRHPIAVGVSAPECVPAGVLADHLATRFHLMNLVSGARKHLGLPELPAVERPTRDDAAE